ncbi:transcriptional regulator, NifA subfamily, Fis Family [Fibrella aestuarina BUZ 2]|uniref:Transcriptional regulator, NifA subfamily, Fis Family n=1 Tax=Fibrella aestuarina BUZ 2 TaxID=1166018 RepID=I0KBE4_9BACT|nr:sigma 54-interacting transcriptional regulator [Fibrella aestuarina]CCH01447.1 transcriptional regulator, NifA subfamily, Fis Family [Fibrella aestuarina BUZ 2]
MSVLEPPALPSLLIVEDEFLIANDLRRILTKAGYRIEGIAGSVEEAKTKLVSQRTDIVLLDIFLAGPETGIDLAHWLNKQAIPFVFLSANLTDSLLEAAKVTQPFGYLTKPFREKDVLSTLEIARYRHAHSEEAKLREQQQIQIAVNNASIHIQDREQFCLAIADQINQFVPFAFITLRIGLLDDSTFYWLMLRKTGDHAFSRVNPGTLLGADEPLLEKLDPEAPDQPGLFSGGAFDQLCQTNVLARACRDTFGVRSLAQFSIPLTRNAITTLTLARTQRDGFTAKDYQTVSLICPQIALTLDNLLAYEELDRRRQIKSIELAIANAFRSGGSLDAMLALVADAINELLPADFLGLYRAERQPPAGSGKLHAVQKNGGRFAPLDLQSVRLGTPISPSARDAALTALRTCLTKPTLNVGFQFTDQAADNLLVELYRKELGLQSVLYVPVFISEQPAASLILASKSPYAFTYKDLHTLQDISVQMALALDNVLAFERINRLSERLEQEKTYLTEEIRTSNNFGELIGNSPAMTHLFTTIDQVAPTEATVLILGETGTGKELVARAVHNLSTRRARTIVKINCAALPAQLIESELFGHERGSFTGATEKRIGKFELASGGTLFLDEIGELPLELQAKLLRAIQEREIERIGGKGPIRIDVRIIAATNRNLQQEVAEGRFRSDLYYRLNVFPIVVPPLRERTDDIQPLALHFLQRTAKKLGKVLTGIANDTMQQLMTYAWPGNIRELEHVLERAAILSRSTTLTLAEPLRSLPTVDEPRGSDSGPVQPIDDTMRAAILGALAKSGGRIRGAGGAAELLHLKPTTLEARMKKLGIS